MSERLWRLRHLQSPGVSRRTSPAARSGTSRAEPSSTAVPGLEEDSWPCCPSRAPARRLHGEACACVYSRWKCLGTATTTRTSLALLHGAFKTVPLPLNWPGCHCTDLLLLLCVTLPALAREACGQSHLVNLLQVPARLTSLYALSTSFRKQLLSSSCCDHTPLRTEPSHSLLFLFSPDAPAWQLGSRQSRRERLESCARVKVKNP